MDRTIVNKSQLVKHWSCVACSWQCTKRCGGGKKHRLVRCINIVSKQTVSDEHCSSQKKPSKQEDCNTDPCVSWATSSWQQVYRPTLYSLVASDYITNTEWAKSLYPPK